MVRINAFFFNLRSETLIFHENRQKSHIFVYFRKKFIFQGKNACFLIETTNIHFLKTEMGFLWHFKLILEVKIGIFES